MSQFATARGAKENEKLFSARVSCLLRHGEHAGLWCVQVRRSEADGKAGSKK
jgi:hypothetical protein